jgi:2-polyprenyl-3-methyl-5-hydroxy-6-metoxy-1,4-benzoquinol methylase
MSFGWGLRRKNSRNAASGGTPSAAAEPANGHASNVIRTLDELDQKIGECELAGAVSDDKLREVFGTFRMLPPAEMPSDPFAPEYRDFQLEFYRRIAGKKYDIANEAMDFDVTRAVRQPFPYATGSCVTTGEQLIETGFILRAMALRPGARVLELGSGWGNMTIALAKLGHSVTAVDIEERFCELVRRRTAQEDLAVTVVNSDFTWVEEAGEVFDAVLFTASFHHSHDHLRLLRSLHRAVTPNGRIFFGAEPIQPDLPYPWGLRLDGQSLWSIRKHGWLELGFNDRYFAEALRRTEWIARRYTAADPGWLNVWEACPRTTGVFRFTAGNGALTQIGRSEGGSIVLDRAPAGVALFGPYVNLAPDRYVARIHFRPGTPRNGQALMDVAADAGARQIAHRRVDIAAVSDQCPTVELPFSASEELCRLEVRLLCAQGFSAQIDAVEIAAAI